MRVYSLSKIDNTELTALVGTEPPVIFVGSGISLWEPSNLPTGNEFTRSVFSLLFQSDLTNVTNLNIDLVQKYFEKLPFEVINERCPDASRIEQILRNIYNQYEPNPIHELLAGLLIDGKLQSIITPNYDLCLDTALVKMNGLIEDGKQGRVTRVINKQHFVTDGKNITPIYFKIHGSTDDDSGASLVFRLNQEGVLEPWKRDLVRMLLKDRTLLVVGYSGSDFDICPEIALAQSKKIIWNFLSWGESVVTPNIKFLSERSDLVVVSGDMRELLSRLYYPVQATIGRKQVELNRLLNSAFDDYHKRYWRVRILNSINYNKAINADVDRGIDMYQDPRTRILLLSEYAAATASSGRYRQAAKLHDEAARVAKVDLDDKNEYITQTLIACDTWRCYGSFLRSIIRYRKAAFLIRKLTDPPPSLLADLDRNLILLIRHPYDFFQRFRLQKLETKMREIAGNSISRSIAYYRENGDWYQLQQVGLWEERFKLHKDPTTSREYETPLSDEGYRQLNFPMGQMMSFRNSVRGLKRLLTRKEVHEARQLASDAKELGIMPEVWKLSLLILRKSVKKDRLPSDYLNFARAFASCQYTLLFGIWRLVVGE